MNSRAIVLLISGLVPATRLSSHPALAAQESTSGATTQPVPIIKVGLDLVQIDATVTDAKGRPVPDLKPEDFTIKVDGKIQAIENAMFFGAGSGTSSGTIGSEPAMRTRAIAPSHTLLFIVDDLNISFTSMHAARSAMTKFAAGWDATEARVGVRLTSDEAQSITLSRSPEKFAAAISEVRYNVSSGMGASSEPIFSPVSQSRLGDPVLQNPDLSGSFVNPGMRGQNFQQRVYSLLTSINALRSVPGRKAVVFVSEGFSLSSDRDHMGLDSPFDSLFDDDGVEAALRMIAEVANRASVVLYTIDPSGLIAGTPGADLAFVPSADSRRSAWLSRVDAQGSLRQLADDTGGLSVYNRNDLKGGLNQVVEDQRAYYLLGFEPPLTAFSKRGGKPKFHNIKVTVNRPGLRVRTRAGFYGVTDKEVIERAPLMVLPES